MSELLQESIAHCLSMDGVQAAKRHIELLEGGWQLRSQFYQYDMSEAAIGRLKVMVAAHILRRGFDCARVAIDACAIGYGQLERVQHEEVVLDLKPGIGLWCPPEGGVLAVEQGIPYNAPEYRE